LLKNPKVVQQQFIGEVGKFVISRVHFLQDVVYQMLLKSVNVSWSYLKMKGTL